MYSGSGHQHLLNHGKAQKMLQMMAGAASKPHTLFLTKLLDLRIVSISMSLQSLWILQQRNQLLSFCMEEPLYLGAGKTMNNTNEHLK